MPKDRNITRENRRREKTLDSRNAYGNLDPTPKLTVRRMIEQERKDQITARSA